MSGQLAYRTGVGPQCRAAGPTRKNHLAPRWFMEPQHVDPVEAARGFMALGARNILAMHWGTFRLTDEAVGEPPERLRAYWGAGLAPERLWICDVGEARALR